MNVIASSSSSSSSSSTSSSSISTTTSFYRDIATADSNSGVVLEEEEEEDDDEKWDRDAIAFALDISPLLVEDVPIDDGTNETTKRPHSFHIPIAIADDVSFLEKLLRDDGGMIRQETRRRRRRRRPRHNIRLWGETTPKQDLKSRRLRRAIFQTDLVEQLLEMESNRCFNVLASIAETHEERSVVISRGMAPSLAKFAAHLYDGYHGGNGSAVEHFFWALRNFVHYLEDDDLTTGIMKLCEITVYADSDRSDSIARFSYQILERVALRGPCVRDKFDGDNLVELKEKCIWRAENFGRFENLLDLYLLAALASMSSEPEIGISRTRMALYRAYLVPNGRINPELISKEKDSRKHLRRSGYLRPGESIYMYLGLCGCPSCDDVRFVGALRLAVQIRVLNFDADGFRSFDTGSARRYAERALAVRSQNDARLLRCNVEDLEMPGAARRGPYALFAESVLRLGTDADRDVRRLGKIAWRSVPPSIQRRAAWSPSLHKSFRRRHRDVVRSMLMMARRGDVPVPIDLLVRLVFPFACDASDPGGYVPFPPPRAARLSSSNSATSRTGNGASGPISTAVPPSENRSH